MGAGDLPAVGAIAAAVHPGHPESDAVFAERLALHPAGCMMLQAGRAALGYAIAHPWHRRRPPPLNTLLGALPARPEVFYLHDLAILPAARAGGAGGAAVLALAEIAGGLPMALVAIGGTEGFWRRQGFVTVPDPALAAVLRHYDAGAHYMERPVSPSGCRR
ncbi:GNAT family N-acetyltransferase [Pararoseomonas sp. SCSIO 73927]|uniref:GNAT family N-acetyltransferase n=1 Tax=Pararoseomonas sp. SCSIO 73927 TaxID=3114537 RepID=UPI0030D43CA3